MISDSSFFLETPNSDLSQSVCKSTSVLVRADAIFVHIFTKDESFWKLIVFENTVGVSHHDQDSLTVFD